MNTINNIIWIISFGILVEVLIIIYLFYINDERADLKVKVNNLQLSIDSLKNKVNILTFESSRKIKTQREIHNIIIDAIDNLDSFENLKIHPYYIKNINITINQNDLLRTRYDSINNSLIHYINRYYSHNESVVFMLQLIKNNGEHDYKMYHKDKIYNVDILNWESEYSIIIENGVLKYK